MMTKSETEGQQRVFFEQSDSCEAADFRALAQVENFTLPSSAGSRPQSFERNISRDV